MDQGHYGGAARPVRLDDRTTLSIDGALTTDNLAAIADILARELGWDDARKKQEIEAVGIELEKRHNVILQAHPAKRR